MKKVTITVSREEARAIQWLSHQRKTYRLEDRDRYKRIAEKLLLRVLNAWGRKGST